MPTFVDSTTDTFGHVHLTNDNGETKAYTTGGLVPITVNEDSSGGNNGYSVGVAKAKITLSHTDAPTLASIISKFNLDDSKTYASISYTFTIENEGHAKVLGGSKPAKSAGGYADRDMVYTLTITSAGVYTLKDSSSATVSETATAGVWEIKFYYGMAPEYTDASGQDDASTHHSADKIKVTASSITKTVAA